MSESEAKEKVTKKSRKRKLTEEVPLRKSSRIANAKPASSSGADKKVSSAKSAPTKNDPDPPKKRGRGRRKAEEEDEEEVC